MGMRRRDAVLMGTMALLGSRPARAAAVADLLLVLAVDASGSVNRERFELQRHGYAAAFRNPRVLAAIGGGALGGIVVTMTQWTGPGMNARMVPWTIVSDAATAETYAQAIERAPRLLYGGGTSLSGAIDHGVDLLAACPFEGTRRVIDVS